MRTVRSMRVAAPSRAQRHSTFDPRCQHVRQFDTISFCNRPRTWAARRESYRGRAGRPRRAAGDIAPDPAIPHAGARSPQRKTVFGMTTSTSRLTLTNFRILPLAGGAARHCRAAVSRKGKGRVFREVKPHTGRNFPLVKVTENGIPNHRLQVRQVFSLRGNSAAARIIP